MDDATKSLRLARESESPRSWSMRSCAGTRLGRIGPRGRSRLDVQRSRVDRRGQTRRRPASAAGLQGEVEQWIPTYRYAVSMKFMQSERWGRCKWRTGEGARSARYARRGKPGFDALADPKERADEQQVRDEVARARQAAVAKPTAASKPLLKKRCAKKTTSICSFMHATPNWSCNAPRLRKLPPRSRRLTTGRSQRASQLLHSARFSGALRCPRDKPAFPPLALSLYPAAISSIH